MTVSLQNITGIRIDAHKYIKKCIYKSNQSKKYERRPTSINNAQSTSINNASKCHI